MFRYSAYKADHCEELSGRADDSSFESDRQVARSMFVAPLLRRNLTRIAGQGSIPFVLLRSPAPALAFGRLAARRVRARACALLRRRLVALACVSSVLQRCGIYVRRVRVQNEGFADERCLSGGRRRLPVVSAAFATALSAASLRRI